MATYAKETEVPSDKSRQEIEATLKRYGAESFLYGWDGYQAVIGFHISRRDVKVLVPLPSSGDDEFWVYFRGSVRYKRTEAEAQRRWEQATRQRWRAAALVIKAKLEAVEAGISTLENEFLAQTLMANGQTVGEWAAPRIEQMCLTGQMPPLIPLLPGPQV